MPGSLWHSSVSFGADAKSSRGEGEAAEGGVKENIGGFFGTLSQMSSSPLIASMGCEMGSVGDVGRSGKAIGGISIKVEDL